MNHQTIRSISIVTTLMTVALAPFSTRRALAQNQIWITQFGTSERENVNAVVSDGAGGVMIAGNTQGSLGGPHAGDDDAFLARYDGSGNQLWLIQFGTSVRDNAEGLSPDGAGGVFVVGSTFGTLGAQSWGVIDAYVARYDNAGNQLWIRQFGSGFWDFATSVVTDGAGGVIVGGQTRDGGRVPDLFLTRYDGDGNQLWFVRVNEPSGAFDLSIALESDSNGGTWVLARFEHLGNDSDVHLSRYDGAGNRLWTRAFGTIGTDRPTSLAPDGAGGMFVAGSTNGFFGGPPITGGSHAWLARIDSAGNRLWIHEFGSSAGSIINALASDGAGGVIVGGSTGGDLGAPNPDPGAFLARFDESGNRHWIEQFGGGDFGKVTSLSPDDMGGVMVAGDTFRADVFLARYEIDSCYADCDQSTGNGVLDIFDFLCFQNSFVNGNAYACDCDTTTGPLVCDIFDFLCYQNAFVGECP